MQGETETPSGGLAGRKRSRRACDKCKIKRSKCEIADGEGASVSERVCRTCQETGEVCSYTVPEKRRGPAPGFRNRQREDTRTPRVRTGDDSISPSRSAAGDRIDSHAIQLAASRENSSELAPAHHPSISIEMRGPPKRPSKPLAPLSLPQISHKSSLYGLPHPLIDELLSVYFTHVHNVWPLIYKPLFNPTEVSPALLLSMLSVASCTSRSSSRHGIDGENLFKMAEKSLNRRKGESRVDLVQAMMLLSLRQTGCGNKTSAFMYAASASAMCLALGLDRAPGSKETEVESNTRSRVFWNCYVLDKSLSEETGRAFLLRYNRCARPFPSISELDEFETWPPISNSTASRPSSVQHVTPRRGYVISCFVWTCRLAMIVEDYLNLDSQILNPSNAFDEDYRKTVTDTSELQKKKADTVAMNLHRWKVALPENLQVSVDTISTPLPHHVIGLAWHAAITLLLHSRFLRTSTTSSSSPLANLYDWNRAQTICRQAVRSALDLMHLLDRHRFLAHASADLLHILSLTTLYEAYECTNSDPMIAEQAKTDFSQCCAWLRDVSKSWPAASSHKQFFDAVVKGSKQLSSFGSDGETAGGDAVFGATLSLSSASKQHSQPPSLLEDSLQLKSNPSPSHSAYNHTDNSGSTHGLSQNHRASQSNSAHQISGSSTVSLDLLPAAPSQAPSLPVSALLDPPGLLQFPPYFWSNIAATAPMRTVNPSEEWEDSWLLPEVDEPNSVMPSDSHRDVLNQLTGPDGEPVQIPQMHTVSHGQQSGTPGQVWYTAVGEGSVSPRSITHVPIQAGREKANLRSSANPDALSQALYDPSRASSSLPYDSDPSSALLAYLNVQL